MASSTASRIELGDWSGISIGRLDAYVSALGASSTIAIHWHGADVDRLIDERHARLVGEAIRRIRTSDWIGEIEVSYSQYGERGSIDVLGWHAATATLAVFEVKTELASTEELLRRLDAKVRLGPTIARDRFGWRAARVGRIVVFPDERNVRRQVARNADVLDVALPATTIEVRNWLHAPNGVMRGRWFLTSSRDENGMRNPTTIRRVRPRHGPKTSAG